MNYCETFESLRNTFRQFCDTNKKWLKHIYVCELISKPSSSQ